MRRLLRRAARILGRVLLGLGAFAVAEFVGLAFAFSGGMLLIPFAPVVVVAGLVAGIGELLIGGTIVSGALALVGVPFSVGTTWARAFTPRPAAPARVREWVLRSSHAASIALAVAVAVSSAGSIPTLLLGSTANSEEGRTMAERRLRAVAATPLAEELADRIRAAEPRLDLVVPHDLLPEQVHPGDHAGDPGFQRTEADERRFQDLLDGAQVLYGIPGERPSQLTRVLRANPALEWVQLMPAGGGSQVKAAKLSEEELGRVRFTTTAGVHAVPLAEWCEFGLLAGFKTLPRLQEAQRAHDWAESRWMMRRLEGSRVLVVGLGSIGRLVAERLARQGVHVAGTSRRSVEVEGVEEVIHPNDLAERIGGFDGVVVTLPGTEETRHLVSAEALAAVKPGVVIANVGRGTVIDQAALVEHLRTGRVGFAALDVTDPEPLPADSPLWDLPNVLISPHTAALSDREDDLIAELFARNATRYLDGKPLINPVNTREFY